MVEATLEDIAVSADGNQFLVLLRAETGGILPISIDALQAMSIAQGRAKEGHTRPMTHDLILSLLEMLNAELARIEVTEMRDGVFYAKLILDHRGIEYDIDARPSDALALAVRTEVPIFIAEDVLENEAVSDMPEGSSGSAQA